MAAALFLNNPGGGWVESVVTFDTHRLLFLTAMGPHRPLKYWTARSWASAARRLANVPRFRRLPLLASFLREYKRNWPVLSFRIIAKSSPLFLHCITALSLLYDSP